MIMKTTHRFFTSVFFTFLFLIQSAVFAQLQWVKVFKARDRISIIYFYNRYLGFIGIGVPNGSLIPTIYRTTDGGKTWAITSTPHDEGAGVNDIFMENEVTGWAASDGNNGMVWKTIDGGKS